MVDLELLAAEDAELDRIRVSLVSDAAVIAAAEARRIRGEARAYEIGRARMDRQRLSTRQQEMELRSIALEFAASLHVHDRTVRTRLTDSAALVENFPGTVTALETGRISRRHADMILETGTVIDDPAARAAFETVVIRFAENDTPGRTKAYARQLAEQVHPRTINDRYADANDRRLVTVTEIEDGMAELRALLPAAVAFGIHDRLTQMAASLKTLDQTERRAHADAIAAAAKAADAADADADADATAAAATDEIDGIDDASPDRVAGVVFDDRTRDQMRADLLGDLLLTGTPAINPAGAGLNAIHARVQLTIPVTTLTGATSGGGELDGRCAVDDVTARRLAGNAPTWERVFTDPITGTVLDVDRYNPLTDQRRFLGARDIRCRTMGCRRPARYHQIDHNKERHEGGATRLDNLAGFCIGHHTLKTESRWTVTQLPGGSLLWSSPLGHTYRDDPPKRVVFHPDPLDTEAAPESAPF